MSVPHSNIRFSRQVLREMTRSIHVARWPPAKSDTMFLPSFSRADNGHCIAGLGKLPCDGHEGNLGAPVIPMKARQSDKDSHLRLTI